MNIKGTTATEKQTLVRIPEFDSNSRKNETAGKIFSDLYVGATLNRDFTLYVNTLTTNIGDLKNMYLYLIGLFQLLVFFALFATGLAADAPSYPAPGPKPAYPAEVPQYFLRYNY